MRTERRLGMDNRVRPRRTPIVFGQERHSKTAARAHPSLLKNEYTDGLQQVISRSDSLGAAIEPQRRRKEDVRRRRLSAEPKHARRCLGVVIDRPARTRKRNR